MESQTNTTCGVGQKRCFEQMAHELRAIVRLALEHNDTTISFSQQKPPKRAAADQNEIPSPSALDSPYAFPKPRYFRCKIERPASVWPIWPKHFTLPPVLGR
jgi:hypothetical protein